MHTARAPIKKSNALHRRNLRLAQAKWGTAFSVNARSALRDYSQRLKMSVERGDLILIDSAWYVTYAGLLNLAKRRHCKGIDVVAIPDLCDPSLARWALKATVYTSVECKGFVGHGDADPSNVSARMHGAELRIAETRAVNRALRKAYGVGICSVEELGSFSGPLPPVAGQKSTTAKTEATNGNGNHPLRDRLCLLIRKHQLDPALVKLYAGDYCDVSELRQASRRQVAMFIKHLAEYAESDRAGLVCQLNSYAAKPVAPAESTADDADQTKVAGAA